MVMAFALVGVVVDAGVYDGCDVGIVVDAVYW